MPRQACPQATWRRHHHIQCTEYTGLGSFTTFWHPSDPSCLQVRSPNSLSQLCAADDNGVCQFPSKVLVAENLGSPVTKTSRCFRAVSVYGSSLISASLPPSKYVDDTGTTKEDPRYKAFTAALNGRQNVRIVAHFVSQSRVAASNNLHRVWDERMEAKKKKNRKRKGQPTLADAFKKACKKKKD